MFLSAGFWVIYVGNSCSAFPSFFIAPWVLIFVMLCMRAVLMLFQAFMSPGVRPVGVFTFFVGLVLSTAFSCKKK
jgi:hypothetical protein